MEINSITTGDCNELIDRIPEGRFPVLVTDPPFNVGYGYRTYRDRMPEGEYYAMLARLVGKCGGRAIVIHYPEALHRLSIELGKPPERVVSWVYNSNTGRQHRDIAFYGIKPDFAQVTQPYKNPKDRRIAERIERGIAGGALYDWWSVDQVKNVSSSKYGHPCQMPYRVMENVIGIIPKREGLLVVEPFAGTGTTLVACKNLGVDFVGFEIDPEYAGICDARLRYEEPNERKEGQEQLKLL